MKHTTISIITALRPQRLSKGFAVDEAGDLRKSPGGKLLDGELGTRAIVSLAEFATVLESLTSAQALVYGVPINVSAKRIMTKKAFVAADRPANATTRTNEAFAWPNGPGVLMLDYDPPSERDPLDRDALVQAIRAAATGLADAELLWWPSASSCIWQGDKELRGISGQRLYLLVEDASDIPRAGKVLVERLWLAGNGHIEISKSGALLERTLVDASVWQPSRLDFAGGAECGADLEQRRGAPTIVHGRMKIIDSREAFPELTEDECVQLTAIMSEAKRAVESETEGIRERWIESRAQDTISSQDRGDPDKMKAARAIAQRALETDVLAGSFRLIVQLGDQRENITVGHVMDNREKYHGCLTCDPMEPDYDEGRLVGRLYLMQARPTLHSFARGPKTYRLHRAPARIELVKGHTAEAATATIELLRGDPVIYDFGGQLSLVDGARPHPLCEHGLSHHLATVAQFWRGERTASGVIEVDCDPPTALLRQIIAQGERRKLKPLDGVISGPTIRSDGSVLDRSGYDEATRLFFDPMGVEVPQVPTEPTLEQARDALNTLLKPYESFPFVDAAAKGALLAALLTAAVRPVLPTSPAFGFDAPIQGSGKTLLARCVGALVEGREPNMWPHTQSRYDDEEVRKRLFTALRNGSRVLVWDNVVGLLRSASMAMLITGVQIEDRILGKSESIRIPSKVLLILTGNNLTLGDDLPRRVLICRIDPKTDQPFSRQFQFDPLNWTLENRMSILAAACTLIRGRMTHAVQPGPGKLASFEIWDDLVRQTVVWADKELHPGEFGDPMDLVREAQVADPEVEVLFALLTQLRDQFGGGEFGAKNVLERATGEATPNPLRSALLDFGGERALTSAKSLGRTLKAREGRIVNGLYLDGRPDKASGSRIYRIREA
ncbi:hypothetical protein [Hyphomonas sp.]|uniref:hypothetical protein n=1 Tax=Hyphomonas sp. TaxID=87 RepID=UPI003F72C198